VVCGCKDPIGGSTRRKRFSNDINNLRRTR
jgi:hypothetical protein